MWHFEAQLFAKDAGLGKRNGKADAGIKKNVVVGKIVKIAAEDICVEPQMTAESRGDTEFVIISAGGLNGQADDNWTYGLEEGRTGEEQVFERRRLEDAVIGGVDQEVQGRDIARNANSGAPFGI